MGHKIGKLCAKHPELNGLRYDFNHTCVQCHKDHSRIAGAHKYRHKEGVADEVKAKARMRHLNIKLAVLCNYGMECASCGIDDPDVLNIDHVDQRGSAHRKAILGNGGSNKMYRWLITEGFPDGFRTLCYNCNIKAYLEYARQ